MFLSIWNSPLALLNLLSDPHFPDMRFVPWRYLSRHIAGSSPRSKLTLTLEQFRDQYFVPGLPLIIERDQQSCSNPQDSLSPSFPKVHSLWFNNSRCGSAVLSEAAEAVTPEKTCLSEGQIGPRLQQDAVASAYLPYELMFSPLDLDILQEFSLWIRTLKDDEHAAWIADAVAEALSAEGSLPGNDDAGGTRMVRFEAPLRLLSLACSFNKARSRSRDSTQMRRLYIAQAPISDLPLELQGDLPVPELVLRAGKGDIYSTSIWMGLAPTYSPWHRDPNPNLFHQLHGGKTFRIMPPVPGEQVFREAQSRIGLASNPRIRTMGMFQGAETSALHEAIWGPTSGRLSGLLEARLCPGTSLFLPKGWWHSVQSESEDGTLNASVNFWFR
ncbi:hypothetical protein MAPG_00603 [Magnaporthiopsis poae ATCC 64411]|uniref:JmjC domain-containing protein n=1 Tax=Magnaporthiopsis poae (strain ATCC 64411 / 73-15) TaxID=644358 RepID=A0A0C4CS88_MAGP6|nr:hypothetical protein, variant [Magnaporthiopsis poae ATCC 64411]KLU81516.1 hypothetical protein MAPG_00603 [Magnaporthiopsis poae ATCC 64411]